MFPTKTAVYKEAVGLGNSSERSEHRRRPGQAEHLLGGADQAGERQRRQDEQCPGQA